MNMNPWKNQTDVIDSIRKMEGSILFEQVGVYLTGLSEMYSVPSTDVTMVLNTMLSGHTDSVLAVDFSPDGKLLATW